MNKKLMLPTSLCRSSSASQQRKEQQLVMRLCQDIAQAQFVFANPKRSRRLWDEAAALEIEPDRLLNLLYGGVDLDDSADLVAADERLFDPAPGLSPQPLGQPHLLNEAQQAFPASSSLQRIFRPAVLGITATQIFANQGVALLPKTLQIAGDRSRTARR